MILSDALSRQPDFSPDEDHDNEDVVMLPNHMFLQLIDLDLQQKIALSDNLDQQALDALTFLLNDSLTVPLSLKQDIKDWTVHTDNDCQYLFYQGIAYIPRNDDLRRDIIRTFHHHVTAGHPGNWGHIMPSDNIIGGQVYEHSLKTTSRVAASANNSRLIVLP